MEKGSREVVASVLQTNPHIRRESILLKGGIKQAEIHTNESWYEEKMVKIKVKNPPTWPLFPYMGAPWAGLQGLYHYQQKNDTVFKG